jgi:hypothetical protein
MLASKPVYKSASLIAVMPASQQASLSSCQQAGRLASNGRKIQIVPQTLRYVPQLICGTVALIAA